MCCTELSQQTLYSLKKIHKNWDMHQPRQLHIHAVKCHLSITDLWWSLMPPCQKVFAQINTDGEILIACINLCLQTLMVVHQQLNAWHIPVAYISQANHNQYFNHFYHVYHLFQLALLFQHPYLHSSLTSDFPDHSSPTYFDFLTMYIMQTALQKSLYLHKI